MRLPWFSKSNNLVLLFHEVPSQSWFKNTLQAVKKAYRFISAAEMESYFYDNKEINSACHISFDDADRTFYENIFPVLKELAIPATLFASPGMIRMKTNYWFQEVIYIRNRFGDEILKEGICRVLNIDYGRMRKYMLFSILKSMKINDILMAIDHVKKINNISIGDRYNITKDEFCEIGNSGMVAIGAHTMDHPILSNETDDDAAHEIKDSIEGLSEMLGRRVRYFAYPNGTTNFDYGSREKSILRQNGIRMAFTTDKNYFDRKTDPLAIPRPGCSGTQMEAPSQILLRLSMLSVWDSIRDAARLWEESADTREKRERMEIKGIFAGI